MNKTIVILLLVLNSFCSFGQDAEFKKGIFYLNGVAELSLESCKAPQAQGQTCVVKSIKTGEALFSTYVYNAGSTGFLVDISFLDFNEELRTEGMLFKKIFALMYDMKVINDDGTINEERAIKFSRAYDIIKDRKVIIVE